MTITDDAVERYARVALDAYWRDAEPGISQSDLDGTWAADQLQPETASRWLVMARAVAEAVLADQAAEADLYRRALVYIRDRFGRVCEEFEFCSHAPCADSVGAVLVAANVLGGHGLPDDEQARPTQAGEEGAR
jgi:hypothetical protein